MHDSRLDAVAAPELRATLLYVRARPAAVSADDVAAGIGVHRNVARARLERLVRAGLLTASFARRTGRAGPGAGRPAKLYAVAPELDAIEFPRRHLAELVGLLARGLPARRLREAGTAFGRVLADEAALEPRGLEALQRALGTLGFQASIVETSPGEAVVTTPTCPLRPVVAQQPEATDLDAGMWAGLAAAALPDVADVRCETAGCLDPRAPCRVRLRF
jgi:predicted ArsR family transcriptional regulator